MFRGLDSRSRKNLVSAQFNGSKAAADYTRAMYNQSRQQGRFFEQRLRLTNDILASCAGGDLLDAGCGPLTVAQTLIESRPDAFRITLLDQSSAMVEHCAASLRGISEVRTAVGELEQLPFGDESFDVTLSLGTLDYTDHRAAIPELSRVTRLGGLVIVTMLNPLSPYRLTEWFVFWPLLRILGAIESLLGFPAERRHGARHSGIRPLSSGMLKRRMRKGSLEPIDLVHFDVTLLVPPLDRLAPLAKQSQRTAYERKVTRGVRSFLGTAYLVVARRVEPAGLRQIPSTSSSAVGSLRRSDPAVSPR
jgi:ubiquinone/menaquinone biosynthesis C-methylase UbiE